MILAPSRVVQLCQQPAHSAALAEGRALERQHRLHIDGDKHEVRSWVARRFKFGTPKELQAMQEMVSPVTKSRYGSFVDAISKVFTARGTSYYYEFKNPDLQADFEQYLFDTQFLSRLQGQFRKASLTGFQGVFFVDLPAEPNPVDEAPRPYWRYMRSSSIKDAEVRDNLYEYIIFEQTAVGTDEKELTYYVCIDEQTSHVVYPDKEGKLTYSDTRSVVHGLGYVPAFAPSLYSSEHETTRTSIFDRSLPVAEDLLWDYNMRILSKYYHGFQKFWAYGVPCQAQWNIPVENACAGEAQFVVASCGGTGYFEYNSQAHQCPSCKGDGQIIPVGVDKTFILKAPETKDAFDLRDPAGYISPDGKTWELQTADIKELSDALEQAAVGKAGILTQTRIRRTGTESDNDMRSLDARCDDYGDSWRHVLKGVADTMARLRYGSDFTQSAINIGRKYDRRAAEEIEKEFATAKENGATDALLFGLLEEWLYARYNSDPVELEYNRLKLFLDPIPTRSTAEIQQWLVDTPSAALKAAFQRKRNLNDYVARFERENGPLVQFGIRVRFEERIARITEAFDAYDSEVSILNPQEDVKDAVPA